MKHILKYKKKLMVPNKTNKIMIHYFAVHFIPTLMS